jgi:thymidylate kinase
MRPLLISFEGLDGVGKTTLSKATAVALVNRGENVKYVEEFPKAFLDGYIDRLAAEDPLLDFAPGHNSAVSQTLVLLAAHANKYETEIRRALLCGTTVLVDRYTDSVCAYQLPLLMESGISEAEAYKWLAGCASILPAPDAIIYVEADPDIISARIARTSRLADATFLRRVRDAYWKRFSSGQCKIVSHDNNRPIEESLGHLIEHIRMIRSQCG